MGKVTITIEEKSGGRTGITLVADPEIDVNGDLKVYQAVGIALMQAGMDILRQGGSDPKFTINDEEEEG